MTGPRTARPADPAPPRADAGADAVPEVFPEVWEVADDAMAPAYNAGDALHLGPPLRDADALAARLAGRDAVVRLADGRTLVCRIAAGGAEGRFTLTALDGEVLRDVRVEVAAAVVWVRKGGGGA